MKKVILIVAAVIVGLLSGHALAQNTGKIVGQVTDAGSGEPLPGCNVYIAGLSLGASTDQDGYYVILNVPPGVYDVHASMIGYTEQVQKGVRVMSNLTARVNFKLAQQILEGEQITVVAYKTPPVQKDLTYKIQAVTADEISQVPLSTMKDILVQQAGVVPQLRTMPVSSMPAFGQFATVPTDGLHFRGGRENETLYLLDGINVTDGLWGGFSIDQLGELMISSLETYSGTFDPRYGEAMSGVVNISTFDRIDARPKVAFKALTDKHGLDS
ncbi:carboxypeptidase regulatory-like domain-containing protein, partial [Caldithrix abyssi]